MFGVLALAAMVFVHRLAPETKGRRLEEIRQYWENDGRVRSASAEPPVLGLDIGGSTTRAVRAEDGRCVAEARAGSANIRSVGVDEAGRQLDAVLAGLRTDDVAAVCAGAAGADSAPAPGRAAASCSPKRLPGAAVQVVHDARLVLAAADLDAGIAVDRGHRLGGLGRDARTGARPARAAWATCSATRAAATGPPARPCGTCCTAPTPAPRPTRSAPPCSPRAGSRPPSTSSTCSTPGPSARFWAGHAGVVARLAASDPVAAAILGRAADALAHLATTVGGRLGSTGPVVLGGGFAVHEPALRAAVADRLAAAGVADVRVIPRDPVAGAVRLAQRLLETP